MIFFSKLFIRASCSRPRSFVHHIVGDVKFDTQEKMFVLMKLRGFIGLLNRNLTGPGPEISVHPSVTVICNIFFLTYNYEAAWFTVYRRLLYINRQSFLHHVIN